LGNAEKIDSLVIKWQSGNIEKQFDLAPDQLIVLSEQDAHAPKTKVPEKSHKLFSKAGFPHSTLSLSSFNDFKRQALMPNPVSGAKAALVKGDINGDGVEDVFVGGLAGFPGKLFFGKKGGSFIPHHQFDLFIPHESAEDTQALFFDANGNGHLDLYVASGGYGDFLANDPLLQDRLYLNDGKGGFTLSVADLPIMLGGTSCVRASDIDGDGDLDLFVGGSIRPGLYPETSKNYILINDGKGRFEDKTDSFSRELANLGRITDAVWTDLNQDGLEDLVVVGEWMPVTVFINSGKSLQNETANYFDNPLSGWWNTVMATDLNENGRPDLIVGNYGLNSQIKASFEEPVELFFKDFDNNGAVDPILTFYIQGKKYPYLTRDELFDQFTNKRSKFPSYESYAEAGLEDVFSAEELKDAGHLKAVTLETSVFILGEAGKFIQKKLPLEAQFAPVHSIHFFEASGSGQKYLILAGNSESGRLRLGKIDAIYGAVFQMDNQGGFHYIPQHRSGLSLTGDTRGAIQLDGEKFMFNVIGKGLEVYGFREN